MNDLTFGEICQLRSSNAEERQAFLGRLVSAFWRGEFESGDRSAIWTNEFPESSEAGDIVFTSDGSPAARVYRKDPITGKKYQLLESDRIPKFIYRGQIAKTMGGWPDYIPWQWDGTDADLERWSTFPIESWPKTLQVNHFERWRINRDDFARWVRAYPASPAIKVDAFWPESDKVATAGNINIVKFKAWMEAEKERTGRWPPSDTDKAGNKGWRKWIVGKIARPDATALVRDWGYLNERAAPKSRQNKSAE